MRGNLWERAFEITGKILESAGKEGKIIMIGRYDYTVILTYLSLCVGSGGIMFSLEGKSGIAVLCLLFSGLCDAFDGRIARSKKNRTMEERQYGIQIDSLCDIVCFGVLPCCIGYSAGLRHWVCLLMMCIYILAGMIRLAVYNVKEEIEVFEGETDLPEEKHKSYTGLPITSISLILPVIFLLYYVSDLGFRVAATMMYGLVAFAFVKKVPIRKPGKTGLICMLAAGAAEVILLFLFR